jgi:hypothetical protein
MRKYENLNVICHSGPDLVTRKACPLVGFITQHSILLTYCVCRECLESHTWIVCRLNKESHLHRIRCVATSWRPQARFMQNAKPDPSVELKAATPGATLPPFSMVIPSWRCALSNGYVYDYPGDWVWTRAPQHSHFNKHNIVSVTIHV